MRIVFFGDSLTQGVLGGSFVAKIAAALPNHQIVNAGVNGDTSLNLYRRVEQDVIAQQPDAVFILIGVNDASSAFEAVSRPYYRFFKQVPGGSITPAAFRENLRAVIGKLRLAEAQVWVGLPPVEYNPRQVAALRDFNAVAAALCAELNVPTLDLMAALTPPQVPERPPLTVAVYPRTIVNGVRASFDPSLIERQQRANGYSYTFDGTHPTEQGAAALAAHILAFLRAQGVT